MNIANIINLLILMMIAYLFYKVSIIEKRESFIVDDQAINNIVSVYNNNKMTITDLEVTGSFNLLPPGTILAFSGTTIPDGWAQCDGQNGRPDLRDRFLMGVNNSSQIGDTGGASSYKIGIDNLPSHNHNMVFCSNKSGDWNDNNANGDNRIAFRNTWKDEHCKSIDDYHAHMDNTGGDQLFPVINPFCKAFYIIKL